MPPRPTLRPRPLTVKYKFLPGEGTDKSPEEMYAGVVRELVGWDAGPAVDGARNVITSATGAEFLNNYPIQRAPIPGGATLSRATTVTAEVANSNSYPNTMSLLYLRPPGFQGLIVLRVWNGDGTSVTGYSSGYQGFFPSVYNAVGTGVQVGNILTISHAALPVDSDFNYPLSAARNFD